MPAPQRACVYFDFRNSEKEEDRCALRIYGDSIALKEMIADSEKLAKYNEELIGIRIFLEDALIKTKRIDIHA